MSSLGSKGPVSGTQTRQGYLKSDLDKFIGQGNLLSSGSTQLSVPKLRTESQATRGNTVTAETPDFNNLIAFDPQGTLGDVSPNQFVEDLTNAFTKRKQEISIRTQQPGLGITKVSR